MIKNEIEVISNSLWTATANSTPDCPPLKGEHSCDVAIVGGGFTGLSAALHLAERGKSVIVLEAETPGWAASGRNGGQVNPGLKEDPDTIVEQFGQNMGSKMVAMSGGAGQLVFDLIARHGIQCAAAQTGWIQPVHSEQSESVVRNRVTQWARRGAPLRMLSREETADLLGTSRYRAAMIDERGGNLHPLNYALGLAEAGIRAGAKIHGHSRVTSMQKMPDHHILRTADGAVRAGKVLLCTNGYTDGLVPPMRRTIVPIRSIQVATDVLPDNVAKSILPYGHSASDSRRLLLYFRKDPMGRFVMGGRGAYSETGTLTQMQALRDASVELYPQLRDVQWSYAWGGFVAMTKDHYPHLDLVGPNVLAGIGFNGRGVAMGTAFGKVMADWACGVPEPDLDFPITRPRPIPFYFMRKPAVVATVTWARFRDALDR